jgi:predicted DNA-binding protein
MLGIKLQPHDEERLERVARGLGRPKSAVAREWILARMEREDIDEKIRNAATLDAEERARVVEIASGDATGAMLRWLDAEDGGYDWGPDGPPTE